MEDLSYFVEWGHKRWEQFTELGINLLGDLANKLLLDIGFRSGRMAIYFSLKGANVVATDIKENNLIIANNEASKFNVSPKYMLTDGSLSSFPDQCFDIIFTKSVICLRPDITGLLKDIQRKLKPGGQVLFIENGKGNFILRLLRKVKHYKKWDYGYVTFFTQKEIDYIGTLFDIKFIKKSYYPPMYLIYGKSFLA